MPSRQTPGRALRVRLAERAEVARRAANLLEQKQRLLRREQRRLAELAERTGREWQARASDADVACTRALVGGNREDLARAAPPAAASHVCLTWTTQAGVAFPATATVEHAPPAALGANVALQQAAAAYRRALDAAVRHGAASLALERVSAELAGTTRRLRAIRDRLVPALVADLADVDLRLDEIDREEVTRLRRAGRWGRDHTGAEATGP